ncbi:hypothetical protein AB0911_07895 [Streptomyces nigra]|uniref:hypothetical protein n=1 Tax=Streptomyces nigra TaxID=1827580 RepID=UPI003455B870
MPTDDTPTEDRDRDGMGRFRRTLASVRRDAAAAEYQADHPTATLQQIADQFGYYDKGEARRGILRAKADVARPAVTKLIATESEELDALYTEACAILQRNHVTVSHGRVITWLNPDTGQEEPLPDDGPKLQAIQVALRVRESYRKLHGLDQPAQVAVSGGVKYEVVGIETGDLT